MLMNFNSHQIVEGKVRDFNVVGDER